MVWLYIAIGVAGLVPLVPTLLQSFDTTPPHLAYGFVAFAATMFGTAGAVASQFSTGPGTNLIASLALGLAAGAIHPEVVAALARHPERSRRGH